jgi:alanyl-tRNA synthetase
VISDLQANETDVHAHVETLLQRLKAAERANEELKVRLAAQAADGGDGEAVEVGGVRVVAREVEGLDAAGLRHLADEIKAKLGSGVVVLGTRRDGKAQLIIGVTADLAERISAAKLVATLAPIVGGGGGGRADFAEAGGRDASRIDDLLARARELVTQALA